jgi:hypothetical protein
MPHPYSEHNFYPEDESNILQEKLLTKHMLS